MFLAQTVTQPPSDGHLTSLLIPFVPWIPVLVALPIGLFLFFRFALKQQREAAAHLARMRQHMDTVEQKLERIIDKLESRDAGK